MKILNTNVEERYDNNYIIQKEHAKRKRDIKELINRFNQNPDLTEDMVRPDLRRYFGIVKREYRKQLIESSKEKIR